MINPASVCGVSKFYKQILKHNLEGNASNEIEDLFTEDVSDTNFESEVSVVNRGKTEGVDPEFLSKIWSISEDQAANTIG